GRWPDRILFVREWTQDDTRCRHTTHLCAPDDRFGPNGIYVFVDFTLQADTRSQGAHAYDRIGALLVEAIVNGPPDEGTKETRRVVYDAIAQTSVERAAVCHLPESPPGMR